MSDDIEQLRMVTWVTTSKKYVTHWSRVLHSFGYDQSYAIMYLIIFVLEWFLYKEYL